MTFSLYDQRGRGDSGPMCLGINYGADSGEDPVEHNVRPRVGIALRVGSISGRSYSAQDWWQCTEIIEILEESTNEVTFSTKNSVYTWKVF